MLLILAAISQLTLDGLTVLLKSVQNHSQLMLEHDGYDSWPCPNLMPPACLPQCHSLDDVCKRDHHTEQMRQGMEAFREDSMNVDDTDLLFVEHPCSAHVDYNRIPVHTKFSATVARNSLHSPDLLRLTLRPVPTHPHPPFPRSMCDDIACTRSRQSSWVHTCVIAVKTYGYASVYRHPLHKRVLQPWMPRLPIPNSQ